MSSMTTSTAPTTPPGRLVRNASTMVSPSSPRKVRENRPAPIRMTNTMEEISMVVRVTLCRISVRKVRARLTARPQITQSVNTIAAAMPIMSMAGIVVRCIRRSRKAVSTSMAMRLIPAASTGHRLVSSRR